MPASTAICIILYGFYSFAQKNSRTSFIRTLVFQFIKYNSTHGRRTLSRRALVQELQVPSDKIIVQFSKILFHLRDKGVFCFKQNFSPQPICALKYISQKEEKCNQRVHQKMLLWSVKPFGFCSFTVTSREKIF